ncbi:MAG: DNA-directed RNA polymerase subunit A'', partial [Candidatus Aenigmarchaeota archaeon]|nr:DNA-directed RNA polymerase subunit A'' [Candidatus Aenigmarchaeota archaeon]
IMLVADTMTLDGGIRGITRYGISGDKASVLARASFEVPLKHLFNAAVHNEVDNLSSVIENVMINQPIPIGTGLLKLVVKRDKK